MNTFFALLTMAPLVFMGAMVYDLKTNHWEWTDKQRYGFIVASVVVSLWLVKRTSLVWPRVVIAILAFAFLVATIHSYRRHKKIGGNFTMLQLAIRAGIGLATIYIAYSMTVQIVMYLAMKTQI